MRWMLAATGLIAFPGWAQTPQPAIQPPGRGVVEQPCPAALHFTAPKALPEPGKPAAPDPDWWPSVAASYDYLRQYDWAQVCRYAAANAALAAPPTVVFMGDSITENWVRYDPALFATGNAGRGISGQTTPQMLVRFMGDVVALRPRAVHIMAGTNDIAGNTGPTSLAQIEANVRAMVTLAQANGIRVILASVPPAAAFPWAKEVAPRPAIAALNAWLKGYAAERGAVWVDYGAVLATADGAMRPEFTPDGVHPASAGYAAMRPLAERAIAAALR